MFGLSLSLSLSLSHSLSLSLSLSLSSLVDFSLCFCFKSQVEEKTKEFADKKDELLTEQASVEVRHMVQDIITDHFL